MPHAHTLTPSVLPASAAPADISCAHAIQDLEINGQPSAAVIYERDKQSIKITNANFAYADGIVGDGIGFCFTLDRTSECPSLDALCRGR